MYMAKQKQTHKYEKQTSGNQWGERKGERQAAVNRESIERFESLK